jgi:hypothetical protein
VYHVKWPQNPKVTIYPCCTIIMYNKYITCVKKLVWSKTYAGSQGRGMKMIAIYYKQWNHNKAFKSYMLSPYGGMKKPTNLGRWRCHYTTLGVFANFMRYSYIEILYMCTTGYSIYFSKKNRLIMRRRSQSQNWKTIWLHQLHVFKNNIWNIVFSNFPISCKINSSLAKK